MRRTSVALVQKPGPTAVSSRRMKLNHFSLGIGSLVLVLGGTAPASGYVHLDWRIREVYVTPLPAFEGPVTIGCKWAADVVAPGFVWEQPIQWNGMFLVDGKAVGSFTASYQPNGVLYHKPHKDSHLDVALGLDDDLGGTATNEFNGTRTTTVHLPAGPHKVGCAIALFGNFKDEGSSANNKKEITLDVRP